MSKIYQASVAPCAAAALPLPFEQRWIRVQPLLRLEFAARDGQHLDGLLKEARAHLWLRYMRDTLLREASTDPEWATIASNSILGVQQQPSLFEAQFIIIERRLHHWAHQHFKPELVEDIVQGAFIKLWDDYQRHQQEWDAKPESFWVNCGKLAMRSTYRDLRMQTQHRSGSSRRQDKVEWVQFMSSEREFQVPDAGHEDERNDLLDRLSQHCEVDVHGKETQLTNLRLDLETLLKTVQQHYRADIFERCLLVMVCRSRQPPPNRAFVVRKDAAGGCHIHAFTAGRHHPCHFVRGCFQVVHRRVPARRYLAPTGLAFVILNAIHTAMDAAADQSVKLTIGHLKIHAHRIVATVPLRLNAFRATASAVLH